MCRSWTSWGSLLVVLAACGGPAPAADGGPDDAGADSGDPCVGRTLCAAAQTSCDADTLVICAPDGDGCLVETRTSCGATGDVCTVSGGTAACIDPCDSIPAAERCASESRSCSGDTLEICAPNADGCLVRAETDCASSPGGLCDATGTARCVIPADPCDSIPAAQRCDTAGASCFDASVLERCAPDAFGCLVRTSVDCSDRASGVCDSSDVPAACSFTGDPCASITQCTERGVSRCDGPELVQCHRDGFGCYVETRTDCTDAPFGFCDAATPACSTAATDPCMGVAECTPVGRTCDGNTLRVCATNAFGCDVETSNDCTSTSEVCGSDGMRLACVDPCSLVTLCTSAESCDGEAAVHCSTNAAGCLVETSREVCASGQRCEVGASAAACITDALCPSAERTVLSCASGTQTFNTAGGPATLGPYHSSCTGGLGAPEYGGRERVFRFRHDGAARVGVTVRTVAAMYDYDLFVMSSAGGTLACDATTPCIGSGLTGTGTETVSFAAAPGEELYIVEDLFALPADRTSSFTLQITCAPIVCGDGLIGVGETCDDGNTASADGCSSSCIVERGYLCTGTPSTCVPSCGNGTLNPSEECDDGNLTNSDGCSSDCAIEAGFSCFGSPSTCATAAANATCATATLVSLPSTHTGNARVGSAFTLTDPSCGPPAPSANAVWYQVTVPMGATVVIEATGTGTPPTDPELSVVGACSATTCVAFAATPGSSETLVLDNTGGVAPLTRFVAVRAFGDIGGGAFTIRFYQPICGDGITGIGETCDDGNTIGSDGCSATCAREPGYTCTGSPSVCTPLPMVTPIAAACADMTSGTAIAAIGDDVTSSVFALPFTFTLQGTAMTHYSVTSNGFLQLYPSAGGTPSNAFTNVAIPNTTPPNGFIAPFWDDLNGQPGTTLRSLEMGAAGSRVLVIEWGAWNIFSATGYSLTFQAMLYESTNRIELHYCAMTGPDARATGSSATIGYETLDGAGGVEVSFDTGGAAATGTGYRIGP